MANIGLSVGLTLIAAPLAAAQVETAPAGGPDTRYCLKVEPFTGSRIETVKCWTRDKWADEGVDLDKEWAKEGVAVIEGGVMRSIRA